MKDQHSIPGRGISTATSAWKQYLDAQSLLCACKKILFLFHADLHDVSKSGRLGQRTIRRILLALRVPQLSWDSFARSSPLLQNAPSITADEFTAGFFEAFVL